MRMLDHPKVTVPIYDIVIDSHINTRELDEDVIEEYREAMREYGKEHWQSFWNESAPYDANPIIFIQDSIPSPPRCASLVGNMKSALSKRARIGEMPTSLPHA